MTRLNKMARTIWSFATLRLRKLDGESDDCVATWAEDLAWLKRTYYRDHFAFQCRSEQFERDPDVTR